MDTQILVMNEINGSCLCASLSLSFSLFLSLSRVLEKIFFSSVKRKGRLFWWCETMNRNVSRGFAFGIEEMITEGSSFKLD